MCTVFILYLAVTAPHTRTFSGYTIHLTARALIWPGPWAAIKGRALGIVSCV